MGGDPNLPFLDDFSSCRRLKTGYLKIMKDFTTNLLIPSLSTRNKNEFDISIISRVSYKLRNPRFPLLLGRLNSH